MQTAAAGDLINKLNEVVFNPIITLLFGLALVVFLWGVAQYFLQPNSEQAREQGRKHMIYGILGMFIMFTVFAIMRIIVATIGADPSILESGIQ